MNFSIATDEQLWTILTSDKGLPKEYVKELVNEGFRRELFHGMIRSIANKIFGASNPRLKTEYDEIMSAGMLGITLAVNEFKSGVMAFSAFVFIKVESCLIKIRVKEDAQKREHMKNLVWADKEFDPETNASIFDLMPSPYEETERAAIKNIMINDIISKVSGESLEILKYFASGYSFKETAKLMGYKSHSSIRVKFNKIVKMINPESKGFKVTKDMIVKKKRGS